MFGPNALATLQLRAVLGDGGSFTGAVPFSTDFGSGGSIVPEMPLTALVGAAGGPRTASAGWDGGPTARITFRVDALPPSLTLFIEDAGRVWRRDERPRALLVGDEPLDPASAGVAIRGVGVASSAGAAECSAANLVCAVPANCVCLQLDLSAPPLAGISANDWATDAGASDLLGNRSTSVAGPVLSVTRVRWQRTGLGALRSAPALGSDGTIFLGSSAGTVADRLYALNPFDGAVRWSAAVGAVQSVSVAFGVVAPDGGVRGEVVAFAANDLTTGAILGAVQAEDGGSGAFPTPCQLARPAEIYSGIGLASVDYGFGPEWVAVGSISDNGDAHGRPYGYRLSTGTCVTVAADTSDFATPPPTATAGVSNVPVDGDRAYFQGKDARFFAWTLGPTGWTAPGAEIRPNNAGGTSTTVGMALFGQAPRRLALGGSVNVPSMTYLTPADPFNTSSFSYSPVAVVGLPAVIDASRIIAGVNRAPPSVDQFSFPDGGVLRGPNSAGNALAGTSPVLASNGLGYSVGPAGGVTAFSTTAWSTTPVWSGVVPGASGVIASPTLDCLRNGSGGGLVSPLGVLYLATTGGSLTALLVDSPKLDPNAEWPKYQRDSANSGNAAVAPNSTCP